MTGRAAAGSLLLVTAAATATMTTPLKHWNANLTPRNEFAVTGTANATDVPGDSLAVNIQIDNARAGDVHTWHVHLGDCNASGAILGEESRYPVLRVGTDRMAAASARVAASLVATTAYSVNVHISATDHTVVSCGDLRAVPPERRR
jgi:hypothetical protein